MRSPPELYTKAEIDELNEYIKHERDEVLTHAWP